MTGVPLLGTSATRSRAAGTAVRRPGVGVRSPLPRGSVVGPRECHMLTGFGPVCLDPRAEIGNNPPVGRVSVGVPADTHVAGLGSERDIHFVPPAVDPDSRKSIRVDTFNRPDVPQRSSAMSYRSRASWTLWPRL